MSSPSSYLKKSDGYVAILFLLIVGAASLTIAMALLLNGTDSQRSVIVVQSSMQARNLAVACGEEALQQMHDSTSFTGTNNLTLVQGTCTYTVTNLGGASRQVDASGTVNGVIRKIQIYATIGSSSISINSWKEVS